jgi:hypothetical protein
MLMQIHINLARNTVQLDIFREKIQGMAPYQEMATGLSYLS